MTRSLFWRLCLFVNFEVQKHTNWPKNQKWGQFLEKSEKNITFFGFFSVFGGLGSCIWTIYCHTHVHGDQQDQASRDQPSKLRGVIRLLLPLPHCQQQQGMAHGGKDGTFPVPQRVQRSDAPSWALA